jgi:hypothetical protein
MRGKKVGKETGKCPACVRRARSCESSGVKGKLLPLSKIRVVHGLHMVPQRDHRYGYFRLFDERAQQAFDLGYRLPYGAKVSLQVPLVGYNPRENHWRPRRLLPGKEQEYLEFDFSRRLPPPTGMSAEDIAKWDLQPEGEVTSFNPDPRYSPGLESGPEEVPPPVPGPSRRKRKAASPAPAPRTRPTKRTRSTVTVLREPPLAPPAKTFPRAPRPAPSDGDLRVTLLPVHPLMLLTDWRAPNGLNEQQQGLLDSIIRELTSLAGALTTAATSWNNAVASLRYLGQRSGFSADLPMVSMHRQPDVEWEETPVDPQDRKGKKPAWRRKRKTTRGDQSNVESEPAPGDGDDDGSEDGDDPDEGNAGGEGDGANAMVEG